MDKTPFTPLANTMRRTPILVSLLALGLAGSVHAQQAAEPQQKPSEAPPKLETIEAGSDTPVTILPSKPHTQITEKKEGGRVTEVEVQAGKSHYTMKPNVPAGNAQPGTAEAGSVRAPTWKVLEFDIGTKKKKQEAEQQAETEAAPVPPPPRAAEDAKPAK